MKPLSSWIYPFFPNYFEYYNENQKITISMIRLDSEMRTYHLEIGVGNLLTDRNKKTKKTHTHMIVKPIASLGI